MGLPFEQWFSSSPIHGYVLIFHHDFNIFFDTYMSAWSTKINHKGRCWILVLGAAYWKTWEIKQIMKKKDKINNKQEKLNRNWKRWARTNARMQWFFFLPFVITTINLFPHCLIYCIGKRTVKTTTKNRNYISARSNYETTEI